MNQPQIPTIELLMAGYILVVILMFCLSIDQEEQRK